MEDQIFDTLSALKNNFPDEQSCINHLEALRWNLHVVSPFDASSKVYKCPNNTYKCKKTGKYFNVKTGTIFHNSKIDLQKWFIAIWLLVDKKSKMTSVALGLELNITQKTAWYIIKRIKTYDKNISIFTNLPTKTKETKPTVVPAEEKEKSIVDWLNLYAIKK
ncbi:transposase [Flavobacterium sp. CYK-4]|uniref:transposase n=1 Tax=Flavobacterium lotistagni TaxID=2709660 RepID=UPI00140A9844|nr:transposase [Flavobacterium lotistagni]NHM05997.1 transposase [Flavobacterium lotistagni]